MRNMLTRFNRGCVLACGAAAVLLLGGCDRTDEVAQAIRDSAAKLEIVASVGNAPSASVTHRESVYREVISRLQGVSERGLRGQNAAAQLLLARAHAGLGEIEAEAVAERERRATNLLTPIRAAHNRWLVLNALADSLEQYDPSDDLAELERRVAEIDAEIGAARAHRRDVEQRVADLERRMREADERAEPHREREAALRAKSIDASATERAELFEEARKSRRLADAQDRIVAELAAEIALVRPQIDGAQTLIDGLNNRRALLVESRNQLRRYAEINAEQAAETRAEAAVVAEQIHRQLAELSGFRGEIPGMYDEALRAYDAAIGAARRAQRDSDGEGRIQASLTLAAHQHAKADVLAQRAGGQRPAVDTVRSLAATTPPLPEAGRVRGMAEAATEEHEASKAAAVEAYEEAKRLYEGSGARGEVRDRVERITRSLEAIAAGEFTAPVRAPAPPRTSDRPGREAPGDDGVAAVRRAVGEITGAVNAGRWSRLMELTHTTNQNERRFLEATAQLMEATERLDNACQDRFGQGFQTLLQQGGPAMAPLAMMFAGMAELGELQELGGIGADDFDITMDSADRATAVARGFPGVEPMRLVRVDGRWLLSAEELSQLGAENLETFGRLIGRLAPELDAVAGDTAAGRFQNPSQMLNNLQTRLMPILMELGGEMMPGMGPGGG